MSAKQKSILSGVVAGLALLVFYLLIMFLTATTLREVSDSIREFWYFMVVLISGFGLQIGLWVFLKNCGQSHGSGVMSGASGVTSGGAMVACCAHHLADVLPVVGFSGAAVFLSQYQKPFLILGVAVNLFGLAYMLNLYQRHLIASKKQEGGDYHGQG